MLKQNSVFIRNEVGSIKNVTSILKENNLNMRAFSSFDSPEFSILRFITDNPEKTVEILNQNGIFNKLTDIVGIVIDDKPGSLDNALEILINNDININYMYSFLIREDKLKPIIILNVDKMDIVYDVLSKNGIETITQEDL